MKDAASLISATSAYSAKLWSSCTKRKNCDVCLRMSLRSAWYPNPSSASRNTKRIVPPMMSNGRRIPWKYDRKRMQGSCGKKLTIRNAASSGTRSARLPRKPKNRRKASATVHRTNAGAVRSRNKLDSYCAAQNSREIKEDIPSIQRDAYTWS
eukprot:scaffold5937_cov275-Pinguiococcus_pyrenoidosus.AAC.8